MVRGDFEEQCKLDKICKIVMEWKWENKLINSQSIAIHYYFINASCAKCRMQEDVMIKDWS